ncbi:DUF3761 domain-containing protein [Mycobacterium sp.]|jgi:hypothetical protein|uniref:DUF3761 domain-containing protein n=1 Tax=Mycobacterium sp. TaxID=1785 RepID=UPI002623E554|nr:DUF3761 domain-containing protein [Mycobacterium sp.]
MLFRATLVAAAIATAVAGSASPANSAPCPTGQYSDWLDHTCVPRATTAPTPPPGARALCRDGDYSFDQHRIGACTGHGGVGEWLP